MRKRHASTITALTLSASLLTACGGGGGGTSPVPSTPTVRPNGKTQTAITLAIPGKKSTAGHSSRAPKRSRSSAPQGYASRSVQSVAISFTAHGAALPAVNAVPTFATNLTAGENTNNTTCTAADPASGAYSCTILIAAPVGFDDLLISEWDQTNAAPGASPNAPTGNVLAIWASLNDPAYASGVAIQQNQVNTPNVVFSGVVASAQTTLTTTSMVSGTANSTVVGVSALDADSNVITGNVQWVDASNNNVTLTVTGTPSCTFAKPCQPVGSADATDFSGLTAAFNSPADSDTVTYTPKSGNSLANVTFALAASSGSPAGSLYGATLQFTQTNQGTVSVPGAPQATLVGGGPCLTGMGALNALLGSDGNVYVNNGFGSNSGATITQIRPSGNCFYAQAGTGGASWIAAGADGDIWFVDNLNHQVGKFSPAEFNAVSTDIVSGGAAQPIANHETNVFGTLNRAAAGADGNMYVTDAGGNIDVITPQDMSVMPIPLLGHQPYGIAKGPALGNGHGSVWFTDTQNNGGFYSVGYVDIVTRQVSYLSNIFSSPPIDIVEGSDGQMYVGLQSNAVAAVSASASSNPTATYNATSQPLTLAVGPDKNVWFGENNTALARITMPASGKTGVLSEFGTTSGLPMSAPIEGVAAGSDHNLYAVDTSNNAIMLTLP